MRSWIVGIWFSLLLALLPLKGQAFAEHDIHVSLAEIRWNGESSSFEVSIKIFIDDLQSGMSRNSVPELFIGTPKEAANANAQILDYLNRHFHISLDGITLPPTLVGKEATEDYMAIWCYIEYPGLKDPKQCTISDDLLFELYEDQRSIMDIRMSSTHKAYTIFEPGKSTWNYTF